MLCRGSGLGVSKILALGRMCILAQGKACIVIVEHFFISKIDKIAIDGENEDQSEIK